MGEEINAYRILVEKPEEIIYLGDLDGQEIILNRALMNTVCT
jgi:hypothetical protein